MDRLVQKFLFLIIFSVLACNPTNKNQDTDRALRDKKLNKKAKNHQYSNDKPSEKGEYSILSYNLFGGICLNNDNSLFSRLLKNIDIFFTQESVDINTLFHLSKAIPTGYGPETVSVYLAHTIEHKPFKGEKISTQSTTAEIPDRHAIVADLDGLKIANLHLSGGRYDDNFIAKNIDNQQQINAYIKYKTQLLNDVIKKNPDIILGDFNSVYASDPTLKQSFYDSQFNYFANNQFIKHPLNDAQKEVILKLNQSPYDLLSAMGYFYAQPQNEKSAITNCRGLSIIDSIWYKKDRVELKDVEIVEIFQNKQRCSAPFCPLGGNPTTGGLSDHNPIRAKVSKIAKLPK
ncbi:MAG: hypothetical protein KC505_10290 [Myxococcales bacterium]|nr:hypothetical protein [Myxococcales bacterium]USN51676.1 MAG: hypothetical protein H6731_04505 [Myxococcales bacterium]